MKDNKNLEKVNNTRPWDKKTDPNYTSTAKVSGITITSADAYYLTKEAEDYFKGPFGSKWGFEYFNTETIVIGEATLLVGKAKFFYETDDLKGSFEINNAVKLAYMTNGYQGKPGYLKIDEDAYKKLETNTISKALSRLGFAADIYLGKFEDNNYIQELNYAFADVPGKKIDGDKVSEIQKILKSNNTDLGSLLENYQVQHLAQLNQTQYIDIKQKLGGNSNE